MGHRDQLLAAARRLLQDKGYAHITTRDLVAESGTNLASIGYHFGSKAGLLNEALGDVFGEWTTQLADLVMTGPDTTPVGRARLTWSTILRHLGTNRPLLLSLIEALAQAERDPALHTQLADMQHGIRTRIAELVATTYRDGTPATDPRCTAIASFVLAVCDGLALQVLLDPKRAPTPEDLTQGLDDFLAR